MWMVYLNKETGRRHCPYCMSIRLKVVDNDLAAPEYTKRGKWWFKYECCRCGNHSQDINNLETRKERIANYAKVKV